MQTSIGKAISRSDSTGTGRTNDRIERSVGRSAVRHYSAIKLTDAVELSKLTRDIRGEKNI